MNSRNTKYLAPFLALLFASIGMRAPLGAQASSAALQQASPPARFAFGGNVAQIPADFVRNLILVPVRVNGSKTFLFELDSAAATSSIDPERATQLGISLQTARSRSDSHGAVQNAVLELPGLQIPMTSLAAVSRQKFAEQTGQASLGILGKDFFDRVVIEVDYVRQTVQLYDPSVFTYSGQGKSFPISFAGETPLLRAKAEIVGHKTVDADFVPDTALDSGVVFYRAFTDSERISAAHFKTVSASYPEIDDGAKILLGRLKGFQIGPYAVESPVAVFSQSNSSATASKKIAGAIGSDFLRRFTVIFDFPHQRIILEPNLQFNHSVDEDMSGLSLIAKGANLKTFEIVQVQPGTPAADAGIRQGDVIVAVDDEAAADLTLAAIRDLFRQVGHEYKLLIDRQGQSLTVSTKMHRLI
jgi:membrane-associated protease RseP (regulator of RpoE activity)